MSDTVKVVIWLLVCLSVPLVALFMGADPMTAAVAYALGALAHAVCVRA